MRFFGNMSISGKIVAVVLFVVALGLVCCLLAIYFMNAFNSDLNDIVDTDAEQIKLGARINRAMIEVARAEINLIMSTTEEEMDQYSRSIKKKKFIEDRLSQLRERVAGPNVVNNRRESS